MQRSPMAMSPSFEDDEKPADADKNQADEEEGEGEDKPKPKPKARRPKHWSPSAPYTTSVQTDFRDSWCLSRSRMVAPYFDKNQRPSLWGAC